MNQSELRNKVKVLRDNPYPYCSLLPISCKYGKCSFFRLEAIDNLGFKYCKKKSLKFRLYSNNICVFD